MRKSIVELTNECSEAVLRDGDSRFRRALAIIEANRGHKKLFETLQEPGYSAVQAACLCWGGTTPMSRTS